MRIIRTVLVMMLISVLSLFPNSVIAATPSLSIRAETSNHEATVHPNRKNSGLGWLERRNGLRVLHLQGTPYDMGYQQGSLLKEEIVQLTQALQAPDHQNQSFTGRVWSFLSGLYQKAVVLSRMKRDIPAAYLEELRGIVAGAGGAFSLDALLMLQYAFNEIQPSGSSFIALPKATAQNSILHGYNLDVVWPPELWDLVTVYLYEPSEGVKFVAIGFPGMVGVIQGLNITGLSIAYQSVRLEEPSDLTGVPGPILARAALQYATNIDEAYATFQDWPRGDAVISMADDNGNGVVIEYSSQRISTRKPENDVLTAVAYYTSPALLPLTRNTHNKEVDRGKQLMELLASSGGKLSVQSAVAILRERNNAQQTLGGDFEGGVANIRTVTSVLFDSTQRYFWVAYADEKAAAPFNRYEAFSLDKEFGSSMLGPDAIPASPLIDQQVGELISALRHAYFAYTGGIYTASRWVQIAEDLKRTPSQHISAVVLYWLGVAYARTGQTASAMQVLEQAIDFPQVNPYWEKRSLIMLGRLFDQESKRQAAASAYRRSLEIRIPPGPFETEQKALNEEAQSLLASLAQAIPKQ